MRRRSAPPPHLPTCIRDVSARGTCCAGCHCTWLSAARGRTGTGSAWARWGALGWGAPEEDLHVFAHGGEGLEPLLRGGEVQEIGDKRGGEPLMIRPARQRFVAHVLRPRHVVALPLSHHAISRMFSPRVALPRLIRCRGSAAQAITSSDRILCSTKTVSAMIAAYSGSSSSSVALATAAPPSQSSATRHRTSTHATEARVGI